MFWDKGLHAARMDVRNISLPRSSHFRPPTTGSTNVHRAPTLLSRDPTRPGPNWIRTGIIPTARRSLFDYSPSRELDKFLPPTRALSRHAQRNFPFRNAAKFTNANSREYPPSHACIDGSTFPHQNPSFRWRRAELEKSRLGSSDVCVWGGALYCHATGGCNCEPT